MRHGQATLHQVEIQRCHAVHAGELIPDQPLLGRAVHIGDGQHRSRAVSRRVNALRLHADGAQGRFDRRKRFEPMAHCQRALHQVEVQSRHAVKRPQLVADQRLLRGAVHIVDAVQRPLRADGG